MRRADTARMGSKRLSIAELIVLLQAKLQAVAASPVEIMGWAAALLGAGFVIAGAFVRTMIPLRWLAVVSNLGFVIYGALLSHPLTFVVALLLLLANLYRAREMMHLVRQVRRAVSDRDSRGLWLRPYMRAQRLAPGSILFHKGDAADQLYCLVEGQIELTEIGVQLEPGKIFGEIAFFAPDRRRTQTARCIGRCVVLAIDEATLKQLYFQNPAFGFHLIELVAGRLTQDVRRVEQRLAGGTPPSEQV